MSTSTKGKSTTVTFRISRSDLARWQASAERNGLTLSEYVRRRVNERPLKAVKPRYADEQAAERKALLAQAEQVRREEERARANAAYQRRAEADRLSAAAGGVQKWFASMALSEREAWGDLREELLKAERLKSESDASWQRFQGKTEWDVLLSDYLPSESAKATVEPPKPPPKPESEAQRLQRLRADLERAREESFEKYGIRW